MKKLTLLLGIFLLISLVKFSCAQSDVKIFRIDDIFKVSWTEGTDNYEAEYEVWKIEETEEGNIATLLIMPTGLGIGNMKEGDKYNLGQNAKIIFEQIYISGNDKWISISLENAKFKELESSSNSEGGSNGGGSGGGGCFDTDGGKDIFKKGIAAGVHDSCVSDKKISERYCTEDDVGSDSLEECPLGYICSDGACVESEDQVEEINEGGGIDGEAQVICNGCILGDKCNPAGYRTEDKYCIDNALVEQKEIGLSCSNDFECSTNLCVDNRCFNNNLWQKFSRWFSRLFNGN